MSIFLRVDIYRSLLKNPIHFGEIVFRPDASIQIAVSGEGGGGGFSPTIIYQILIKDGKESNSFEEMRLHNEYTPILDFIKKNVGVLFEKVS